MRRIVVMLTVAAVMALMLVVSAMPALAVANEQASCQGLAASTDTLLGGPGARADVAHDVISEEGPPGALFSEFSQFHEGSREACFG